MTRAERKIENEKRRERKRDPSRGLFSAVRLFYFTAFLLLALKDFSFSNPDSLWGIVLAFAVPCVCHVVQSLLPKLFATDKLLLSLTNFLCALGILVLYATNPSYAYKQALFYGVGIVAMIACIYLVLLIRNWRFPAVLLAIFSVALLAMPVLFGKEQNGAKNWIAIGSFSFQPSEIVKLTLVIVVSYYMSRRRFANWLVFAVMCLALLMLQKDLGTALVYYGVTLLLYYASSSNIPMTMLGVAGGIGAGAVGYKMFAHVKKRVAIWRNPWRSYDGAGYQLVQGLMAIASGGLFGVGLGLGSPKSIPIYHTDFIFAVICEQFGVIFGVLVLVMYAAIIWRGATIAMASRRSFHGLVAMGCTLIIGLQTFTIIGGVIKLIPLTGVTMPFVSYGGTSLVSSLCMIGLMQGVDSLNDRDIDEDTRLTTGESLGSQTAFIRKL